MENGAAASSYDERVKATRAKFVGRIDKSLDSILDTMAGTGPGTGGESQTRKVYRLLHDMAGNAAMLGVMQLDETLREGVLIAETADKENRQISPQEIIYIQSVIAEARRVGERLSEEA